MEERAPGRRRIALVAGAFLVPVLIATVVAFALREPVAEKPESAGSPVQQVAPSTPGGEPTYGKFVPPEARPQVETRAPDRPPSVPTPKVTPKKRKASPRPSRPPQVRPPCPHGWGHVPWWRPWCLRNGYSID
ncbi:hypothetical protein [Actinomadura rubrisoli]|uniref:Uncharacterized protein n=1 Tax=Actinomadura rubrisoli TaxID=2530368 RepID=A0A4R5BBF6_9ACTN|nr:hypothetical protein [Actinomadura rubrisoli]TDD82855.1 hypothetical protein E1298_22140 [Actinomadura rubrisoli]